MAMSYITAQDIQLSDLPGYNQFKQYWDNQDYVSAINAKSGTGVLSTSEHLDFLFQNIEELEYHSDPTFKSDRIPLSSTQPTTQTTGQVWFQII